MSLDEYLESGQNSRILIGVLSPIYTQEIRNQLDAAGLEYVCLRDDSIYHQSIMPVGKALFERSGQPQYFSLPQLPHVDNEVFVDCGTFDETTPRGFLNWAGGSASKIFAFEADRHCAERLRASDIANDSRFVLIEKAVSNKSGRATFSETGNGTSFLTDDEEFTNCEVEQTTLDEALKNENITFIKMDIEGAELCALEGACDIIRQQKPKLAISVYHKIEDIWEIPAYIWTLNPNYEFYLRHYSNQWIETVLYAIDRSAQ